MWQQTHSTTVTDVTSEQIWRVWADINSRHLWDLDIEWARITGDFEQGAVFHFKPKGGPKLAMTITECVPYRCFTDCFKMPFARMYGKHEMTQTSEGLCLSCTITVEGSLGWVLRKMVAEKVAAELPEQTAALLALARKTK